ncbi:hypothetical protein [Roseateles sp.]|uniref:hypothetical protein n=1 Tax=Roseateles sp. TaxID=1971397 RepID=UPI0025F7A419|nr:hypothetical protein [Roseateles sp.]MBV8034710.1 hypothetical protein [Roseateles sp.]
MSTRFLLLSVLACGQALAQSTPSPMPATEPAADPTDCAFTRTAPADPNTSKACDARMSAAAMPDPDKMLAGAPPGAGLRQGPLSRSQVVDEISRARHAGELDWAAMETGLDSPRRVASRR